MPLSSRMRRCRFSSWSSGYSKDSKCDAASGVRPPYLTDNPTTCGPHHSELLNKSRSITYQLSLTVQSIQAQTRRGNEIMRYVFAWISNQKAAGHKQQYKIVLVYNLGEDPPIQMSAIHDGNSLQQPIYSFLMVIDGCLMVIELLIVYQTLMDTLWWKWACLQRGGAQKTMVY